MATQKLAVLGRSLRFLSILSQKSMHTQRKAPISVRCDTFGHAKSGVSQKG